MIESDFSYPLFALSCLDLVAPALDKQNRRHRACDCSASTGLCVVGLQVTLRRLHSPPSEQADDAKTKENEGGGLWHRGFDDIRTDG